MAKNIMQSVVIRNAKLGVRVTGTDCGSTMARGFQAPILSLPWQPLPGYPAERTALSATLFAADNAAMAQAIHRAGRSVSGVGR